MEKFPRLDTVVNAMYLPEFGKERQEDKEFRVIFPYIMSLKDPVSKSQQINNTILIYKMCKESVLIVKDEVSNEEETINTFVHIPLKSKTACRLK